MEEIRRRLDQHRYETGHEPQGIAMSKGLLEAIKLEAIIRFGSDWDPRDDSKIRFLGMPVYVADIDLDDIFVA